MSAIKSLKANDKYLINVDEYKIVRVINSGGFGIINLVKDKKTGDEYACKTNIIQSTSLSDTFIAREANILIQIQHPTIVQFRGFSYTDFDDKPNITILMDYMKEGSLANLIQKVQNGLAPKNYNNTVRQIILIGIARGMMVLHSRHVIHRDLKPENILLDENLYPHITDFGLSKFFDPTHSMSQSIANSGTAQYMAPEVIDGDHFNTKADVYAFGILMYEIITCKRAYQDLLTGKKKITVFNLKKKVCEEDLRPKIEEGEMKKGQKLMIEKCWLQNPKERPTFSEIYKKLSLSKTDYFTEFESDTNNQKIFFEKEEEEEEVNDEYYEMVGTRKFCFDDVEIDKILDYVDLINVEPKSLKQISKKEKELATTMVPIPAAPTVDLSKIESKILSLEKELADSKSETSKLKEVIEKMDKTIKDQFIEITSLKSQLEKTKKNAAPQNSTEISSNQIDLKSPGILQKLMMNQNSRFDRSFIASQSGRDLYNLIDPNTTDEFITSKDGNFYIEFQFEESIMINGVEIFSSDAFFPKSFNIVIDGKTVKSIKEADELNGKFKSMKIGFSPTQSKKVCFLQTGPNWDRNNDFISLKRIEFFSPEIRFSSGVFATLIKEIEDKDPHKCPVHITSSKYNFDNFYLPNSNKGICTLDAENSWFQIEFTKSLAILKGFRIKRTNKQLKDYKIICSDDANKPISEWTTLISINEKAKEEHKDPGAFKFPHISPPTRFVRLIQTDKNWSNNNYLQFFHFDLFGSVSLEKTVEDNIKNISDIKSRLGNFYSVKIDMESPGILHKLMMNQTSKFDTMFIASQSGRDIYNLMDPNAKDDFFTNNVEDYCIEFELEKPLMINGVEIFSSYSYFPKSFDILINGKVVKSIKEANDLNGKYKSMRINFSATKCRKLCFLQTGPNWDKNDNYIGLKRIEIHSPETRFITGVFSTFIRENEDNDPHKCPVHITSTKFDFNDFYLLNANNNKFICTLDAKNSWFQIEFTKSIAILKGFRIKRTNKQLKDYKIICSDDANKPISEWTTLISINERTKDEHKDPDVYEFSHISPPTRIVRLIQTDKNWSNNNYLQLFHFDLFGSIL